MGEVFKAILVCALFLVVLAAYKFVCNLLAEKCPRHPGHTMEEVGVYDRQGFRVGSSCSACQDESESAVILARLKHLLNS